ncbi:hypothetical protein MGLY_25370 [Neomoorella glycerini]|uniref:MoaD/ThiS family protein n=1 Tax=Neomoorella glycerini TaxID=55779 RepID=A0A6I5ZUE2_9FIRM|nr:MoaD/ThiS family protein [Moorella glycerini]QGP93137.1 hypothetical protein MGLY_25370 [Moorella glycerini]
MIRIKVTAAGHLPILIAGSEGEEEVPEGCTLRDFILRRTGLPPAGTLAAIGAGQTCQHPRVIIMLNGLRVPPDGLDIRLRDGDAIALLPLDLVGG